MLGLGGEGGGFGSLVGLVGWFVCTRCVGGRIGSLLCFYLLSLYEKVHFVSTCSPVAVSAKKSSHSQGRVNDAKHALLYFTHTASIATGNFQLVLFYKIIKHHYIKNVDFW